MSNTINEGIKENIFEELLEAGFTENEIIEYGMVDKRFFEEATIDQLIVQHHYDVYKERTI